MKFKHPELREGEVWVTNTEKPHSICNHLKTKRIGLTAYDIYGERIPNMVAIFASKIEAKNFYRQQHK